MCVTKKSKGKKNILRFGDIKLVSFPADKKRKKKKQKKIKKQMDKVDKIDEGAPTLLPFKGLGRDDGARAAVLATPEHAARVASMYNMAVREPVEQGGDAAGGGVSGSDTPSRGRAASALWHNLNGRAGGYDDTMADAAYADFDASGDILADEPAYDPAIPNGSERGMPGAPVPKRARSLEEPERQLPAPGGNTQLALYSVGGPSATERLPAERAIVLATPLPAPVHEAEGRVRAFSAQVLDKLPDMSCGPFCEFEVNKCVAHEEQLANRPVNAKDFPHPLKECACGCCKRIRKSAAPGVVFREGVLNGFRRTGWFYSGQLVALMVPNATPVLGRFIMDAYGTGPGMECISIQDLATGHLYCCPLSWLYCVCVQMIVRDEVRNPREFMLQVTDHTKSSTMGYRFVYVLDLHAHLHQLAIVYEHCLDAAKPRRMLSNGKIIAVRPDLDTVSFWTRAQVADAFADPKYHVDLGDPDAVWIKALDARVRHRQSILTVYQKFFLLNSWGMMPASVRAAILNPAVFGLVRMDQMIARLARECNAAAPSPITIAPLALQAAPGQASATTAVGDAVFASDNQNDDAVVAGFFADHDGDVADASAAAAAAATTPADPPPVAGAADDTSPVYPDGVPDSPVPADLFACPFGCNTADAADADEPVADIAAFAMANWIESGQQVALVIGRGEPRPGLIYFLYDNPVDARIPRAEFVDIETGRRFCCPRAWIYGTYMHMYARGLISDTATSVDEARRVLRSKLYAAQCIHVVDVEQTLAHLLTAYRMSVNSGRLNRAVDRVRARNTAAPPHITFLTGYEVRAVVAALPPIQWPHNRAWAIQKSSRIGDLDAMIGACCEAVDTITNAYSCIHVAHRVARIPLHAMPDTADLLEALRNDTHRSFMSTGGTV